MQLQLVVIFQLAAALHTMVKGFGYGKLQNKSNWPTYLLSIVQLSVGFHLYELEAPKYRNGSTEAQRHIEVKHYYGPLQHSEEVRTMH